MAGGMHRFYGTEGSYVSLEEILLHARENKLPDGRCVPVCIWSGRGQGKTAQVGAYCKKYNLEMVTYHPAHDVNGQNIVGEPIIDEKTGKVSYAMPDYIPDSKATHPGVWFIDEINRANEDVLAGLMEPLGEGTIAQSGWSIPKDWQIVVAANPTEVGYDTRELDEAMMDRMLHYNPGWEPSMWSKWARGAGVDEDIIEFVIQKPEEVSSMGELGAFELPKEVQDKMVASPRSITYFASLYYKGMSRNLLRVIGYGLIGREATASFIQVLDNPEKSIPADIILAEPKISTFMNSSGEEMKREIYLYESILERWSSDHTVKDELVQASVQNMIGFFLSSPELLEIRDNNNNLIDITKLSIEDRLKYNRKAQLAGRFLARLSPNPRSSSFASIERMIPEWFDLLQEASKRYLNYFAQQGELLNES